MQTHNVTEYIHAGHKLAGCIFNIGVSLRIYVLLLATAVAVVAHGDILVNHNGFGRYPAPMPIEGSPKTLVVLVEYSDLGFSMDDPVQFYNRFFNENGFSDYGATGSVRDWFASNSDDRFSPDFTVCGPVKLDNPRSYYGGNDSGGRDRHPAMMVIEACAKLDREMDFSVYDQNGDGVIDNVFICYPGLSEEDGGPAESVWPHSGAITELYPQERHVFDSVLLDQYCCTAEMSGKYDRPAGIGVYVHEFSHLMGLPDLYQTSAVYAFTPGEWSVLDRGPECNEGRTPSGYSSFELFALGWIDVEVISASGRYELPPLHSERKAYAIATDNPNELFFLENRQREGYDRYLPYHGMVVWHVDYNAQAWIANIVNNDGDHQRVDLIEADGLQTDNTRNGDTFPGRKKVRELGFHTVPSIRTWSGKKTGVEIYDIEEEAGLISFIVEYECSSAADTVDDESVISVEWADLYGRRCQNPGKGVWLKITRRADSVVTEKVIL